MSENTTEKTAPEGQETDTGKQGDPAPAENLGEGGKKALDAERTARKAAEQKATDLQRQLDTAARANESELEKAQREAQEAKAEVEKLPSLVADQLRDHLAQIHEIDAEQRELYLTSNEPSTLLKQAMGLVDRKAPPGPKPDLTQGGSGTPPALNSNALEGALKSKLGIS